jgi:hypothetical protein
MEILVVRNRQQNPSQDHAVDLTHYSALTARFPFWDAGGFCIY